MARQANKGGEIGANGEFYTGGTFIATTDRPKGKSRKSTKKQEVAPYVWEVAPDDSYISIYPVLSTYMKDDMIWTEVVPLDMSTLILKLFVGKNRGRKWFREVDGKVETF